MTKRIVHEAPNKTGLRDVIERQGRVQRWLAEQLVPKVPTSYITRWCNGELRIPEHRVIELARVLGVSPEEIR